MKVVYLEQEIVTSTNSGCTSALKLDRFVGLEGVRHIDALKREPPRQKNGEPLLHRRMWLAAKK